MDSDGNTHESGCDGQPTWADDLAVLFKVSHSHEVAAAIKFVVEQAEAGLLSLGLVPNFSANKSEALPFFHGPGSRSARRQLLASSQPTVAFRTLEGRTEHVRLIREYTHLGSVIRHDLSEIPNIRRREAAMFAMYKPIRAKLLVGNSFLTVPERVHLLRERVFSRYLFGSGLWRLATQHEVKAAEDPLTKVVRGSLKAITGISSRGLTTLQCAAIQGLPMPHECLIVERARTACELAAAAPVFVWHALLADGVWISAALNAVQEVAQASAIAWDANLPASAFQSAVAAMQVPIRQACRNFLRLRISARPAAEYMPADGTSPRLPICVVASDSESEAISKLVRPHACHCGATFLTARLLAVHKARMHRIAAPLTGACFGTRCERCGIEYWDWHRLRGHLRKSPQCYATYAESDLEGARPTNKGRSGDPCGAWCPPARTEGPAPFWATLAPARGGA